MADNESKQRPVRKLTVKNFSVIKEAELEFGKITVLIGLAARLSIPEDERQRLGC